MMSSLIRRVEGSLTPVFRHILVAQVRKCLQKVLLVVCWLLSADFKYVNSFKKVNENVGILIMTFQILHDLQCMTFLHFIHSLHLIITNIL